MKEWIKAVRLVHRPLRSVQYRRTSRRLKSERFHKISAPKAVGLLLRPYHPGFSGAGFCLFEITLASENPARGAITLFREVGSARAGYNQSSPPPHLGFLGFTMGIICFSPVSPFGFYHGKSLGFHMVSLFTPTSTVDISAANAPILMVDASFDSSR